MVEITTRIALASGAFNRLSNIWRSKTLSTVTKLRLFNSCVIPVLTYGCESWKCSAASEKKLLSFENKCLRKITNTHWSEFKSNDKLREETHQNYISDVIRKRRWSYIGHVLRSDENRIHRQSLSWTPSGKRARGRPKETLRRTIFREIKSKNINSIRELHQLALDRQNWRVLTSALCANFSTRGK